MGNDNFCSRNMVFMISIMEQISKNNDLRRIHSDHTEFQWMLDQCFPLPWLEIVKNEFQILDHLLLVFANLLLFI